MELRKLKDKATEAFGKGRFAKAAEFYEAYCQKDPRDHQSRLRLGDAWTKAGNKSKALAAYQGAAEGFAKEGFLPRAIAASKLILEIDPAHQGVQQMLAGLYARKTERPARSSGLPPMPAPARRRVIEPIELPPDDPEEGGPAAIELGPPPPQPSPTPPARVAGGPIQVEIDEGETSGIELSLDDDPGPVDYSGELPAELQVFEEEPAAARAPPPPAPPEVVLELALEEPEAPSPTPPPRPEPQELVFDLTEEEPEQELSAPQARAPTPPAAPMAFAPPGLRPKRGADGIQPDPGLPLAARGARVEAPARNEALPAPAAEPSGTSRVWLPGQPQEPAGSKTPASPSPGRPKGRSELAASLDAFSSFEDIDFDQAPAAQGYEAPQAQTEEAPAPRLPLPPAPASTGPSLSVGSFTELEFDGDSLLHAVEKAAAMAAGTWAPDQAEAEEAIEEPEEPGADVDPAMELPKIPLFSDLPPDAFIALFDRCPLLRLGPGERVFGQGSVGDAFYVICEGSVRILREDGGERRQLASLSEGAFFGEMALLSGAPRTATVESSAEDTQLLEISAAVLADLSQPYPQIAKALRRFCRQRLLSNLMASSALFQPFTREERKTLVERFRAREVPKEQVVIQEGAETDGLYVVLSGEVEVRKGPRALAHLKEGEVFGEMSLLNKTPATATVVTSKRTSLLRLPRADFDELMLTHPQILVLVAELTEERRRKTAATLQGGAPTRDEYEILI